MRIAALGLVLASTLAMSTADARPPGWSIVVHGGAGVIERGQMDAATEQAYRDAMKASAEAGAVILRDGGSALDAIEAVIRRMEDDPLFNAGRGAVFTAEGRNELDAAIMDGATLKAGAVAGLRTTQHPISAARAVMEKSPHVLLMGEGAERFAREQALAQVEPSYFFTERRWQGLERELSAKGLPMPPRPAGAPPAPPRADLLRDDDHRFGTVGVVARDSAGRLAAGTSTGGTTAKRWGRVGDTPVIGAGTYADAQCAVSATGTGEYFIRLSVARTICARMALRRESAQRAADEVIRKELTAIGGDGGVIVMDKRGAGAWSFNSPGMYRARLAEGQPAAVVAIYKDEP
jgi:beta-aspartyl-peptidase (threonine type)